MKPLVKSRLVWVLAAVVAAQLALYLRRYLPAEQAALLSDELVATLCAALGISGIGLRAADKRRARTAGAIVNAKAAKAAAKVGAGLALALLCGCSSAVTCPTPIRIDAERDTPTGAPMVAIRCNGSVLWRQPCPDPEVTNGRLLCGGADAGVALPLEVTRG